MCGIGGILSGEKTFGYQDRRNFFIQAMYAGTLRGFDSTGLFLVPRNDKGKDIIIRKKNVAAPDFLDMTRMTKGWLNNIDYYNYAIFHNRAATRGSTSSENAHPFQHGNITLVHNGTLSSFHSLTGKSGPTFTVDSEAITWAFNEFGHQDVIPELEGAFALVWHDKHDDLLRAVRNTERPLHFATVEKEKTVLMASEGQMISWLAARNSFKIDTLYTLSPGEVVTFPKEEPTKFSVEKIKIKPEKKTITTYCNSRYSTAYIYNDTKSSQSSTTVQNQQKREDRSNALLKPLKLKVGELLDFLPSDFKIYATNQPKSNQYGRIIGKLSGLDEYPHEIVCHSLKLEEWDWCIGTLMSGTITSAMKDGNTQVITILIDDLNVSDLAYEGEDAMDAEPRKVDEAQKKTKVDETFVGPAGVLYEANEFKKIVSEGCTICGYEFEQDEYDTVYFGRNSEIICTHCIAYLGWDTLACNYGVHQVS